MYLNIFMGSSFHTWPSCIIALLFGYCLGLLLLIKYVNIGRFYAKMFAVCSLHAWNTTVRRGLRAATRARANAPPGDATAQELTDIGETDTAEPSASPTGANVEGPSTGGAAAQEHPGTSEGQLTAAQVMALARERRNAPRDVTRFRLADV